MDQILKDNDSRFSVISKLIDSGSHIGQQLCNIESITSSINEDHLKSLIENTTELESLLKDTHLRREEFERLTDHCHELEHIVGLSRIIDECIDDPEKYELAIDAIAKIELLYKNHGSQSHLIEVLFRKAERQRDFLIASLSTKLEASKSDEKHCVLQIVNNLIKCGNFTNRDLRLRYLQARDNWFVNACEESSASFDDVVSVYSKGLPMIFTEYKSIFGDSEEESQIGLKFMSSHDNTKEGAAIINSWLLLKTSIFISSLEVYLRDINQSASLTPTMIGDTIDKCFKLTKWLSTIGFDFSQQLRPLFSRAIIDELKRSIERATVKFETAFTTTISKSIESLLLPVDDEILRISNINSAGKELPKSIEHYPIFKIYCLYIVDSLRWLQTTKDTISPISLCCETYAALNSSLTRVTKALSITLNLDNNSHHPILTKIAISLITEVLPYVAAHCEDLLPERTILNALGLTKAEYKAISQKDPGELANFRLNFRQIAEPLRSTMRSLVETVED